MRGIPTTDRVRAQRFATRGRDRRSTVVVDAWTAGRHSGGRATITLAMLLAWLGIFGSAGVVGLGLGLDSRPVGGAGLEDWLRVADLVVAAGTYGCLALGFAKSRLFPAAVLGLSALVVVSLGLEASLWVLGRTEAVTSYRIVGLLILGFVPFLCRSRTVNIVYRKRLSLGDLAEVAPLGPVPRPPVLSLALRGRSRGKGRVAAHLRPGTIRALMADLPNQGSQDHEVLDQLMPSEARALIPCAPAPVSARAAAELAKGAARVVVRSSANEPQGAEPSPFRAGNQPLAGPETAGLAPVPPPAQPQPPGDSGPAPVIAPDSSVPSAAANGPDRPRSFGEAEARPPASLPERVRSPIVGRRAGLESLAHPAGKSPAAPGRPASPERSG